MWNIGVVKNSWMVNTHTWRVEFDCSVTLFLGNRM